MDKSISNSYQLKFGSFLSYFQMGINIIIGLLYTPIMLRLLGQSEYGLYNTVSSTISMLSILNLGFNSGYIRFYSKYKKDSDQKSIDRLNGLFIIIFSIIGTIALICGLFLTFNLHIVFKDGLSLEELHIAKILMILLTSELAIYFPMSVFSNIISAHERFVFLKLIGIIKTVLGPLVTLPVLLLGYKAVGMVSISVLFSLISDAIYMFYAIRILNTKFSFRGIDKKIFGALFVYTSFIAINIIIDQINWNVDKILLGRFKGTTMVAIYSVGSSLYFYFQNFSTSISGVFAPRIHNIVNEYKNNELKTNLTELFLKVGRIQFLVLALVASGFCIFGKKFIYFWAGENYHDSYYVALLLILPAIIPLIQNIGIEIQRAQNKHRFRSVVYLIMAIINVIISIILCQIYGAIGAAIGTAISLILVNGIIINIYYYKECYIDIPLFWKNILSMFKGLLIPIILGLILSKFVNINSIIKLIVCIMFYTFVYIISMWNLSLNTDEKALFLSIFKKRI